MACRIQEVSKVTISHATSLACYYLFSAGQEAGRETGNEKRQGLALVTLGELTHA